MYVKLCTKDYEGCLSKVHNGRIVLALLPVLVLVFGVVVSKLTTRRVYFIYLYVYYCYRNKTAVN